MKSTPVIGLSGGIASGKTKIGKLFRELGGYLIDADKIGHEVIQSCFAKRTLSRWYGRKIFDAAGQVNRSKLADISFSSKRDIRRLNNLIHPIITRRIKSFITTRQKKKGGYKFIILDAALLLETGLSNICDVLIFVDTAKRTRQKRAYLTRGWSLKELNGRERFQVPLDKKKRLANFIIYNNRCLFYLNRQVKEIIGFIIELSRP